MTSAAKLLPHTLGALLPRSRKRRSYATGRDRVEGDGAVTYTPYRLEHRLDASTVTQLVHHYDAGTPTTQLTVAYRLSKASVLQLLQEAGVQMRRQGLDDDQTTEAFRLYASGLSLVRFGEQLGFGPTSVASALRAAGVRLPGRPWLPENARGQLLILRTPIRGSAAGHGLLWVAYSRGWNAELPLAVPLEPVVGICLTVVGIVAFGGF